MRKKISLLLCAVAVMLCFTACESAKKGEDTEYNEAAIEQTTEFMIQYCTNADDAMLKEFRNMKELNLEFQLMQSGIPITAESFLGALNAWEAAEEECGEYKSHGDFTSEITNEGYKLSAHAKFADREATISFIFDDESYMETMTVDAKYSMGEILAKAGMNTILGMGTVFVVLIFISFLIAQFKVIPTLFGPKKKEEPASAPAVSAPASVPETAMAQETDDTELIAVIAAAIAAAREEAGMDEASAGGFFVRSIRRRPANKWKA
mgnify:FL=1